MEEPTEEDRLKLQFAMQELEHKLMPICVETNDPNVVLNTVAMMLAKITIATCSNPLIAIDFFITYYTNRMSDDQNSNIKH